MFKITPKEALQIQKRQILHYADLFPGGLPALEKEMADKTNLEGMNLNKNMILSLLTNEFHEVLILKFLFLAKPTDVNYS
jgi:hypothetical protein